MVKTLDSNAARNQWSAVLDEAASGRTEVVITRYGMPVAAVIAYEKLVALKSDQLGRKSKSKSKIARHKPVAAAEHRLFGFVKDDRRTVEQIMDGLREGRYRDI